MSRMSDRHTMLLDHVRFHGVLVELSKLWGDDVAIVGGMQYIDGRDEALRHYASRLAHCFTLQERQGARRR